MTHALAVGAVEGGEPQPAHFGRDQARAHLLLAGQPPFLDAGRVPAQDGHPVPGLLTMDQGMVPPGLQCLVGKMVVSHLQLLQANQVGLTGLKPVQEKFESRSQPVDIPGGNFHGRERIRTWEK